MSYQKIDEQLNEMEEQLSRLIGAIEAVERARESSQATTAALKKAQADYRKSTESTISALDDYGKALTSKGGDLLSATGRLTDRIDDLPLAEAVEGIEGVSERVKEALCPKLEQLASAEQLDDGLVALLSEAEAMSTKADGLEQTLKSLEEELMLLHSEIEATSKKASDLEPPLKQLAEETKRLNKFILATAAISLAAAIASLVGLFL